MSGRKPDRVPVVPFATGYAARLCGLGLKTFYTDMKACVQAQLLARDLHGYDQTPIFGWADWGGWEFGGEIQFPISESHGAPWTARHPVEKVSDLERLKLPDPQSAGWYPLLMEFNRLITGLGFPAKIPAGSVTSVVAGMIGVERLLRWYLKEPEAVRVAYRMATDLILKGAEMVIGHFGTRCSAGYGAPLDANSLISNTIFERFAWPCLEEIHRTLMEKGVNRFTVHLCGDHRGNLEAWAALTFPPRSIISIGSQVGIMEAAAVFGPSHIIAGNVSTTVLAVGSYEDVLLEARRCIEVGKDLAGGFILMPACEMPVLTPPINVHALLVAARKYGTYE